jgi:hypothetical protein
VRVRLAAIDAPERGRAFDAWVRHAVVLQDDHGRVVGQDRVDGRGDGPGEPRVLRVLDDEELCV